MHFLNNGHLVASVGRLIRARGGNVPTLEELPAAYRSTISGLRPVGLGVRGEGINITYEDGEWAEYCRSQGIFQHILEGSSTSNSTTRRAWVANVDAALQLIQDIHPGLRYMVDLLVTDLVVLDSGADGGGSASQMPGVVIMSPRKERETTDPATGEQVSQTPWEILDYAMCLVHESLHLALFILDMVYGTFTKTSAELEDERHRALSAVKIGQMRPLDKAFHAAIVAVPLMFMERVCGKRDLVDLYTQSLGDACESLENRREFFTPYGAMLLDELARFGKTVDFRLVEQSITDEEMARYAPSLG
ncbi:HEXXH motif domain-containing protein [Streptomyces sp. AJS327]|uniref:aKG-HExxH-type peptide beta-hydroxylase n=1 Tax=Streptomyces sp. AJS327 TaxID=2545265 RepID=UPI0015DE9F7A|nr:HEXXH motif-containing putative peptide modification protein [Streptomyces sp. AJS327]MBA0053949.1 HEXXH motif domain-containing protein [Streptomyces sp. AJS327]